MLYPKDFYYSETQSGKSYQLRATGKPDIPRLVHGHPDYWIPPAPPRALKKKKLILADWTASYWNEQKQTDILAAFLKLLDEGFEVYFWQDGQLKPLLKETLTCLQGYTVRCNMMPPKKEKILKAAAMQQHISPDEMFVVDDYWVNHLLSESDTLKPRTLRVSDFCRLEEKQRDGVLNWVRESKPVLRNVIFDQYSEGAILTWAYLCNQFPKDMIMPPQYRHVRLVKSDICAFQEGRAIINLGVSLNLSELATVERLVIEESNVTPADLLLLLIAASKLKTLELGGCTNLSDTFLLEPRTFPHLENLHFSTSNITTGGLQTLLNAAPNVKNLQLYACKNITEALRLAPGSLLHLEKVGLGQNNSTTVDLETLLKAAPNLSELNLSDCENITGDITFLRGMRLSHLESLSLRSTNITIAGIQTLLAAAPIIKSLFLCKNKLAGITFVKGSLDLLEEINLSSCTFKATDLQSLLAAAPKLNKINLAYCKYSVDSDLTFSKESLPLLEEMNLNSLDIPLGDLQTLLTAASNLKILDLSNTKFTDFKIDPGSLLHLEELDLTGSKITASDLQVLLMAAPNLKTINLKDCKNIAGEISLALKCLPKLESIDFHHSAINSTELQTLLAAAPHLKKIDLADCINIPGDITLAPKCLPELEKLDVGYSNITTTGLQNLLTAAPKLTKIQLTMCENLLGNIRLPSASLLFLEDISIDFGQISATSLQTLLSAAPHLKKLCLSFCRTTTEDIMLNPGSLPLLNEMGLQSCNLSPASLEALLTAAPELTKLDLSNHEKIPSGIKMPPHLKILELTRTNITSSNLQAILNSTPMLKELDLVGCEHISGDIGLPRDSLPDLAKVDLTESSATLGTVFDLVGAAPKLNKDILMKQIGWGSGTSASPGATTGRDASIKTRTHDSNQYLDADTHLEPNKMFHLNRTFYPLGHAVMPAVGQYRLDVFNAVRTNDEKCTLNRAFSLRKVGAAELVTRSIIKSSSDLGAARGPGQDFYGKQKLNLTSEWQALASLSPQEEMLRYNTTPEAEVEIKYSMRDNLYYIRSNKDQTVDIDFVVHVPDEPIAPADPKAHLDYISKCKPLVDYFLSFKDGALTQDKDKPNYTGDEYLNAILKQKKGACRHRTFAFKALMQQKHPEVCVRIINNDCHSFVEVKVGDIWRRCDLGGYPASIVINENNNPSRSPDEPLITRTVMPRAGTGFERALQTWDKSTSLTKMPKLYYQQCLNGEVKNRLIECPSAKDADALHYAFQDFCQSTSRPVFYVNSPDDLICSAPYMYRGEDNTGELRRGPGGALYQFLEKHSNGVIIVNYGAFKVDDMVRFNTLVDKERKADGTNIPSDTIIIGLLNLDTPNPLPGSDFYSRFNVAETCPLSSEQLAEALPALPEKAVGESTAPFTINLYHAPDWEERLVGHWVPSQGSWRYEKGQLQIAIEAGATIIEIENGLWENKEFCRFWREAQQAGIIKHGGRVIELPKGIKFVCRDGYNWKSLAANFEQETSLSETPLVVLNPATLGNFFGQYHVNTDKQLVNEKGFIKAARYEEPQVLHVYLTRELNDDQWAMLLAECEHYEVKIVVCCAPAVPLPKALQEKDVGKSVEAMPWDAAKALTTAVVQSTDIDATVAQLTRKHPDSLVIDVSECHDSDLLVKINSSLINKKDEPLRIEFNETICAAARALEAGQTVVLKGRCSLELADELAPLLIKRASETHLPGKLFIVSDNTSAFQYTPQFNHNATHDEKRVILLDHFTDIPTDLNEPLCVLEARCRGADVYKSWLGLRHLPGATKDPGILLDAPTSTFTIDRINVVNSILAHEPYVFLTGLSGVGKTTFVTHELCQETDILYQGETSLLNWAKDKTTGKRKLLFLDEANLSRSEWSAFEGLFNQPQGILIDGEYHTLTNEHKVIFAGNPMSYGGERNLAPFFERHGNAVVFEPLPSHVIYEQILKPVFKATLLESKTVDISKHLLDVYRFLCLCSESDLLISPRELQMIALLTISYCSRQETAQDVEAIAKYFAYHLVKPLVPAEKLDEFKTRFESTMCLLEDKKPKSTEFLVTPSRQHINQLLDEFLALREIRSEAHDNEAQSYGGLGGIVLEGEPGIGKSEMVIASLRAHGYEEMHDALSPSTAEKPFYRMQVSMSMAEKEELLLHAFNDGAVVVIDEINSSPMMERLLNGLLMGLSPDGTRPERPGFMIIATQNPITMGGRRAPSTALSRRMTTVELPPYTAAEMCDILRTKGLAEDISKELVAAYQTQNAFATAQHLTPAPTFRDLLKLAEKNKSGSGATSIATLTLPREPLVRGSGRFGLFGDVIEEGRSRIPAHEDVGMIFL